MSHDIIISGRGLCRHYPRGSETVRALDGVDIDIRAGESVCILGPSGSGKTTLINLLSALDAPTHGTLTIDGRRVDGLAESALVNIRRGTLGYVFQKFHLIPTLTVAENIALPLLFLGRKADPADLRRVLDAVGLSDRANHLPKELSGGQMQRVAIARALVHQPRLVLADEPTGNLDPTNAARVLKLLGERIRDSGAMGILVTHSPEAAKSADRVLQLTPEGLHG